MNVKDLISELLNHDLEKEIVLQRGPSMLLEVNKNDITEDDKHVIITQ